MSQPTIPLFKELRPSLQEASYQPEESPHSQESRFHGRLQGLGVGMAEIELPYLQELRVRIEFSDNRGECPPAIAYDGGC